MLRSPTNPSRQMRPADHLFRAVTAKAAAEADIFNSEDEAVATLYPTDRLTEAMVRGAVVPASLAGSAAAIAPVVMVDFLEGLTAQSAAARLITEGLRVSIAGVGQLLVPRLSAPLNASASWVAEGEPIPVRGFSFHGPMLEPGEIAIITAITRSLARSSNAEAIIGRLLSEDASYVLDASLFDATAASAARPAGLLNGVTPTTATAGGDRLAMVADMGALAATLAANGGSGRVVYIMGGAAHAGWTNAPATNQPAEVWASRGVPVGTVVAIDPAAFVSGIGETPKIETGTESTLHFEDEDPQPISEGGEVAAPSRSMWQIDGISIRCILEATWGMRAPGLVQVVHDVSWQAGLS